MIQWLRFHTSSAVGMGSIPGQGTNIPHAMWYTLHKKEAVSQISKMSLKRIPSQYLRYFSARLWKHNSELL